MFRIAALGLLVAKIALLCVTLLAGSGCTPDVLGIDRGGPRPVHDREQDDSTEIDRDLVLRLRTAFDGDRQVMLDYAGFCEGMERLVRSSEVTSTQPICDALIRGRELMGHSHTDATGGLSKEEFAFLNPPHKIKDDEERLKIRKQLSRIAKALREAAK